MKIRPVKGVRAVREAFAGPLRVRSGPIAATAVVASGSPNMQYVVTVARARMRRAVDRNRIKRILREALRMAAKEQADNIRLVGLQTIVLFWRGDISPRTVGLSDAMPHVKRVVRQLCTPPPSSQTAL